MCAVIGILRIPTVTSMLTFPSGRTNLLLAVDMTILEGVIPFSPIIDRKLLEMRLTADSLSRINPVVWFLMLALTLIGVVFLVEAWLTWTIGSPSIGSSSLVGFG